MADRNITDIITNYFTTDININEIHDKQDEVYSYMKIVSAVLAGLSFILNLFIILTLMDFKLKTHLKLVLSLAFSDLFLALFLILGKFIQFPSLWEPFLDITHFGMFDNFTVNNTAAVGSIEKDTRMLLLYDEIPEPGLEKVFPEKILSASSALSPADLTDNSINEVLQNFMYELPPNLTDEVIEILSSNNKFESTALKTVLACAYLIPTVTNFLTMLFITLCMLVSVVRPLHYRLIMSKRRGTVLVLCIWGFGFAVSGAVTAISMDKTFYEVVVQVVKAQQFIWYGGSFCFVAISIMYCIIFVSIRRQSAKQASRAITHRKAAVTALTVITTFAIFNLPIFWVFIARLFNSKIANLSIRLENLLELFLVLNTVIDPVIYAIRLDEVTNGINKLKFKLQNYRKRKIEKQQQMTEHNKREQMSRGLKF